jgi:hypothetical protein
MILLVTRRLQLNPGEQGIVRPHHARPAVLDRERAVSVEDGVQPVEQRTVVTEQSDPFADAADVCTRSNVDVVVELQEAEAEIPDEEID